MSHKKCHVGRVALEERIAWAKCEAEMLMRDAKDGPPPGVSWSSLCRIRAEDIIRALAGRKS